MYPFSLLPEGWPEVHLYGVMIAIGILAAFVFLMYAGKKMSVKDKVVDFVFFTGIASIAVGFFSAAVFQAFYDYLEHPENGFSLSGRITFIGGLIGGVVCFLAVYFLLRKRAHGTLSQVVSIAPCSILVAHGFGRLGCLFAGCCYGAETDSIFGVEFLVYRSGNYVPEGITRHPTQLYEALFLFAMFALCTFLLLKFKFRHNMSVYLVSYGIFRFLIEYVRDDARGTLAEGISPSQFWAIFMVVIGVALYFWLEFFWSKYPSALAPADVPEKAKKTDAE